jgi:hypothetical protein
MTTAIKTCFKCGIEKPLLDFYKHPQMGDGHLNKCKTCTKKDVSSNYRVNIDHYKQYEQSRQNHPHRVAARVEYQATPRGKEALNKSRKRWQDGNPEKRKAQHLLNNAVRDGRVQKPDACWYCGATGRIHGHHSCYDLPLAVTWLCPKCHSAAHKLTRSSVRD